MPRRGLTRRCKVRINGLRNDALRLAAWPLLVATAALAAGGCASGPQLPFSMPKFSFFKGKEPDKTGMEKLEQLAAEHRDRPLISPDSPPQTPAWRRFLQQPFQAKPRVAQLPDAVNLKNRPESVNADVFLHAARLHEVQGHLTAAADSYQRALSADPNHEGTLLSFARMHDRNGEFAEATKLYERAVAANPNSAVAFNDYGLCSVRQGQTTRGLQLMSKAIALDPKKPLYRNNIAQVLVATGRLEDALQHLQAVYDPAVAHYNLGYWLEQAGQREAALAHFVKATELQPQLEPARQMVAKLQSMGLAAQAPYGQAPAAGQAYPAHYGAGSGPASQTSTLPPIVEFQ